MQRSDGSAGSVGARSSIVKLEKSLGWNREIKLNDGAYKIDNWVCQTTRWAKGIDNPCIVWTSTITNKITKCTFWPT